MSLYFRCVYIIEYLHWRRKIHNGGLLYENNIDFQYKSKYNENEEKQIFKKINELCLEDSSRYKITQTRLKRLLSVKANKGDFKSFDHILDVGGIGVKIMENMCDSFLVDSHENIDATVKASKPKIFSKGKFIEPQLDSDKIKEINSVTALFTKLDGISWVRIDRKTNNVTDWMYFDFKDLPNKKLQMYNIMEMVWSVCKEIPTSDVFVMESMPTVMRSTGADTNNPRTVQVNLQRVQLTAMLSSAINIIHNNPFPHVNSSNDKISWTNTESSLQSEFNHKVYYLQAMLPPRVFKIYIGNERVSGQCIVDMLLNQSKSDISIFDKLKTRIRPIEMPQEIRQYYKNQGDITKEILSQVLLLGITFMELCIYKNIH